MRKTLLLITTILFLALALCNTIVAADSTTEPLNLTGSDGEIVTNESNTTDELNSSNYSGEVHIASTSGNESDENLTVTESSEVIADGTQSSWSGMQAYWMWASSVNSFNPWVLRDAGVTDIFFLTKGTAGALYYSQLQQAITICNPAGIRVHAWIICFRDTNVGWIDPTNTDYQNSLRSIISYIVGNYGVSGIHLDYVRYSGVASSNHAAWQQPGGTAAAVNTITGFVQSVYNIVKGSNSNLAVSASVMPEKWDNDDLYGQDYGRLADYLDFIVPMTYKGNYNEDTAWIGATINWIVQHSKGKPVIAGLQAYRSDSDTTVLSQWELYNDAKAAIWNGASGYALFRYGLSALPPSLSYSNTYIASLAGTEANGESSNSSISPDGRYIVFQSDADNLVANDTNGCSDIFVKDGWTGAITRVSTTPTIQANGPSSNPKITPDGRYIVFQSLASNLVDGDTNGLWDIFVKDGWTGAIFRMSTNATGGQANGASSIASITPNGRYIVFESLASNLVTDDTNGAIDVFVKDGWTGQITRVSTSATGAQSNGSSNVATITQDGRYISFQSNADNLVSGDTNGCMDVFVKDGWTGQITRVSTAANGVQSNGGSFTASITSNGRYIAFQSSATNLVTNDTNGFTDVFVKDGWTGQITRVSTNKTGGQANGESFNASITQDGRYIAFQSNATNLVSGDTNGCTDVFVKDGWTKAITRVSTAPNGTQTNNASKNASITPNGRYISFESDAKNLIAGDTNNANDIFVKDGWTGAITRVNTSEGKIQANNDNHNSSITPDGRYTVFSSDATNLVAGDTNGVRDIFVRDGWNGQTYRLSLGSDGTQANGASDNASISQNGRYMTFESTASNLVAGDINGVSDIFIKDGWTGIIVMVSTASNGTQGNGNSYDPQITPDGRYIVFESDATNLVAGDINGVKDIFVRDCYNGQTFRLSVCSNGTEANGASSDASITPNGRYIVFESAASNLVNGDTNGHTDVFVKDGWSGAITRISIAANGTQGNDGSYNPVITPDGRYIVFESDATNLVSGDTEGYSDIFVKDGWTGAITRISAGANGDSSNASITNDGRYIAFESDGNNLVAGDTNGVRDIFVEDGWTSATMRASVTPNGAQAEGASKNASITPDGRYVVFESDAANLYTGDTNGKRDIFVRDRGI